MIALVVSSVYSIVGMIVFWILMKRLNENNERYKICDSLDMVDYGLIVFWPIVAVAFGVFKLVQLGVWLAGLRG